MARKQSDEQQSDEHAEYVAGLGKGLAVMRRSAPAIRD